MLWFQRVCRSRIWSESHFWWPLPIKGKYMVDLMYCSLHLPLLKLYSFSHPCGYLILQRWRRWCWAQCLARRAPAGRLEFTKATLGQDSTERSAGVDSGELKAWLRSGGFWLWEWGHGSGTPVPPPPPPTSARLPHICALSNPEAGSCSLSL